MNDKTLICAAWAIFIGTLILTIPAGLKYGFEDGIKVWLVGMIFAFLIHPHPRNH